MKMLQLILSLFPLIAVTSTQAQTSSTTPQNNCIKCHSEIEDENGPAHQFVRDVHFQRGLTCADCHGGDSKLDDMDAVRKSTGYRGAPEHLAIPQFCARCHSDARYMHEHNPSLNVDQFEKYQTSVHGMRLAQKKDAKVATCVSCHTAHQINTAKMPYSTTNPKNIPATCGHCHSDSSYMAEYGIPTNQQDLYRKSVHGVALLQDGDIGAPACNSCHGNHGAAPPGISSLDAVCGMCHAIEARLFDISAHKPAFEAQGLPLCMTCHSNHGIVKPSDRFIGFDTGQICGTCHSADDGSTGSATIKQMSTSLGQLVSASDSAGKEVQAAALKGMMTTDEEFALKDIDQVKVQVRSSVHAFAIDSLLPKVQEGLTKSKDVQKKATALIDEYYFRRWGLGISTIIISLLALALYLKIRTLD